MDDGTPDNILHSTTSIGTLEYSVHRTCAQLGDFEIHPGSHTYLVYVYTMYSYARMVSQTHHVPLHFNKKRVASDCHCSSQSRSGLIPLVIFSYLL